MKKKKIKLCLTKQLLNMFKLWCEWGISLTVKVGQNLNEIGNINWKDKKLTNKIKLIVEKLS